MAVIAGVLLIVGLAAIMVVRSQQPPSGVRAIVWDRESCAHCGMTISDHRFACQLQTASGEIYDFDDPGCLLSFLGERHPAVHAIYFHALEGEAWLQAPAVAFVTGQHTPMGYGLGAVADATPNAIGFERAQATIAELALHRHGGGGTPEANAGELR